jgi:hypothetical protein
LDGIGADYVTILTYLYGYILGFSMILDSEDWTPRRTPLKVAGVLPLDSSPVYYFRNVVRRYSTITKVKLVLGQNVLQTGLTASTRVHAAFLDPDNTPARIFADS